MSSSRSGSHPTGWLDGRVALVTGGASGIGRAVAERFTAEGALVAAVDRDADGLAGLGESILTVAGDVTSYADNARAVDAVLERYGRLDVFVGNAGMFDYFTPLADLAPEKLDAGFDELFALNVKAYLLGARAAMDALTESRGTMIFTVSNSGLYAGGGGVLYVTSKHAVVGLVRQLAYELAPDVRVNGVAPGGTITNLAGVPAAGQGEQRLSQVPGLAEMVARGTPLGFAAQPADHAGIYVLLASRENSPATTGAVIPSDGGLEVRGGGKRRAARADGGTT